MRKHLNSALEQLKAAGPVVKMALAVGWALVFVLGMALAVESPEARSTRYAQMGSVYVQHDLMVEGTTDLDDLDVDASGEIEIDGGLVDIGGGTGGTADGDNDLLVADDAEVDDTLDVDGNIDLDGDGFDVNITTGFSIDGDLASNISIAAGDLTIDAESGSVLIIGSEAAADAIELDANDTVTSGVDIDVGEVSGMTIDGGLLDIGGGTCGVADADNDVCIAGVLEVDDEFELDGALDADSTANIAGNLTLQALLLTSFSDRATSDGDTITPTVTTYALDTTGDVTITLAASASEGQPLIIINDDDNATIIADTNLRSSDGNAITLAGANDIAMFVYQDSEWNELLTIANS